MTTSNSRTYFGVHCKRNSTLEIVTPNRSFATIARVTAWSVDVDDIKFEKSNSEAVEGEAIELSRRFSLVSQVRPLSSI